MNCKSVFAPTLLLATLLLLAAPVQSCVNFKAQEVGNNNGLFTIQLWDNNSEVPVCSMTGYPAHDEFYEVTCNPAGYSATFDRPTGNVVYVTDHGTFYFGAPEYGNVWKQCEYGCNVDPGNTCFV